MRSHDYLTKREQQIMEAVYERGEITATELTETLPGKPSNSTVRTLLRILEEKRQLTHEEIGGRYVYRAIAPRQTAARGALQGLVRTFFQGSPSAVLAALLADESTPISESELARLREMIDAARGDER